MGSIGPFTAIYEIHFNYVPEDGRPGQNNLTMGGWVSKATPFLPHHGNEILDGALIALIERDMPGWERNEIDVTWFAWTDMHPIYDTDMIKKLEELDQ